MSRKITTAALAAYFSHHFKEDANATLQTACEQLRASSESTDHSAELIAETQTLIEIHGGDCLLSDFTPDDGTQTQAGSGARG